MTDSVGAACRSIGNPRPSFHRDDGSRASSREFEEPDLPWAQDPSPTTVKFGEDRVKGRVTRGSMDPFLVKASSMLQDICGQDDYEDDFARTEACFCWKLDSHTASWTCNLHSLPLAWIVFQKMGTYELVLHGQQSFGGCRFNIKRL